jgi:hypothetical protein
MPKWQEEWQDTYHLYIWHGPISQISGSQMYKKTGGPFRDRQLNEYSNNTVGVNPGRHSDYVFILLLFVFAVK